MRQVAIAKPLVILLGAGLLVVALVWLLQRRLIYFPLEQQVPRASSILSHAEEVVIETRDGLRLGGWFLPPPRDSDGSCVLVCNGNAGNRSNRAPLAAALAGQGLGVLLFDYRGYGGNPGKPSEEGLLEDGRAARAWLEARPEVDAGRIVIFGESLGAAVAVAEAVERPPAALVLRSPFTSLVDVARRHYPFLPVSLLLIDRYPSRQRISSLRCPLLVVAAEEDRIVPVSQSRALYEAAPGERKRLLILPGGHNDFELLAGDRLLREMRVFLDGALGAARCEPGPENR